MSFASIRGSNGCRHEVDFGDDPVEIDVTASTSTVQITIEAVSHGDAPERRRFATVALPRPELMIAGCTAQAASLGGRVDCAW